MKQVHKAFVVLSAAIAMDGLADPAAPAPDEAGQTPKQGKADKDKSQKKERVQKVRKARRRPSDQDDFGLPAGTLYDVIAREDLR